MALAIPSLAAHRAVYKYARARARGVWLALATVALALAWPARAPAGPSPGTWVPNVAHGTATDSLTGAPLSAVSDTVRASIQALEALTLTSAPDTLVSVGSTVVFAHRLTDTGNVPVDARLDLANLAGDSFDLTSLALWRDVDGDGRLSPPDQPMVPGGTITLAVGESVNLLVGAQVPAGAPGPSAAWLMLRASGSAGGSAVVIDTTLTPVAVAPPTMAFYQDAGFTRAQRVAATGAPLYLEAVAPGCDTDPTRPDTVTITLVSQLTGDVERYRAAETGPATGRFRVLPQIATALASPGSGISGSGVLDESPDDQVTATLAGCGAASTTAQIWIDPAGTVFDARSDRPQSAVQVTLVDLTGAGNGGHPGAPATVTAADGSPAPSTVTTDASGRFQFAGVPASTYRLDVTPPATLRFPSSVAPAGLPAGHRIDAAASYGAAFVVTDAGAPLTWDVPVDAVPGVSLFVEKTASEPNATWGDVIEYAVAVANRSDTALTAVTVHDQLPRGFAYVAGSARRDTAALADPLGGAGPALSFALGGIAPNRQTTLRYRLRVGAGAPTGDAMNSAVAVDGDASSNVAHATVEVSGGVFATEGIVTGSVYLDRDGDGRRARDERGVPGVRVVMDDGTWAITDGDGRFSFYGLTPRTHALSLDRTTLPEGAVPVATTHRERGTPGLRSVDLRNGELLRADFALRGDAAAESAAVHRTLVLGTRAGETDRAMRRSPGPDPVASSLGDLRGRPASGVVDGGTVPVFGAPPAGLAARDSAGAEMASGDPGGASAPRPIAPAEGVARGAGADSVLARGAGAVPAAEGAANPEAMGAAGAPAPVLGATLRFLPSGGAAAPVGIVDRALESGDRSVDFIGIPDGDTLLTDQLEVNVKGHEGDRFELRVNGVPVPETRVGRKRNSPATGVEAWQYVGVRLDAGTNVLWVAQEDAAGNEVGQAHVHVVAPAPFARLELTVPPGVGADGHSRARIGVRALDAGGLPVPGRRLVTLETDRGSWATRDLDDATPGLQLAIENGAGEAELIAPWEPGHAHVRAACMETVVDTTLDFVPELRPLVLVGMLEGRLDVATLLHGDGAKDRVLTGFEQPMDQWHDERADGRAGVGAHAGVYLKGRVADDVLVTMGYDSDRPASERMFRDIQPDAFYPVYGDESLRGYDAQTTGRLYARADRRGAWLQYGDFTPITGGGARSLVTYNRSLTGVQEHWEDKRLRLDAFASRDRAAGRVDELPGLGISGPYQLSAHPVRENSELVELVVRDRNQPGVVLRTERMSRFSDYELDPWSGELLFKQPVPMRDGDLNPTSVRVTYELATGGDPAWVAGAEGHVQVAPRLDLGGTYVDDHDPLQPFELRGLSLASVLAPGTRFDGEYAFTHTPSSGDGSGGRIELSHETPKSKGLLYGAITDSSFANRSTGYAPGRAEAGMQWHTRLAARTLLRTEGIYTGDVAGNERRGGLLVGVEQGLNDAFRGEFGARVSNDWGRAATSEPGIATLRGKLSAQVPRRPELSGYLEFEQDVVRSERRMAALGGEYRFSPVGRLYLRHELISSFTGPYALTTTDRQLSTVFGVDADLMRDAHVFSEYRLRDALSGREAEAAIGLRQSWSPDGDFRVSTSFERVNPISRGDQGPTSAVTGAIESLRDTDVKASARVEVRSSRDEDRMLWGMAAAWRVDSTWTALGRAQMDLSDGRLQGISTRQRLQLGMAFRRPETSMWTALGRYELHTDRGGLVNGGIAGHRTANILSLHAAGPLLEVVDGTFVVAAKEVGERDGLTSVSSGAGWAHGRLSHDLGERWDVGVEASALFVASGRRDGLGVELGRDLGRGVWMSAGWNRTGYEDPDLPDEAWTRAGLYLRIRARFDESIVSRNAGGQP